MMRTLIFRAYIIILIFTIRIRFFLFGFENVNNIIQTRPKETLIPILRMFGARIGNNCEIETPIKLNTKRDYTNLTIGDNVYIGKDCFLDLKGKLIIKNNVVISMRNCILSHIDLGKNNVLKNMYPQKHSKSIIEESVYIGASCTVLGGVTIASKAIVAAGSVVAKMIKKLFDP
jgi:acetyltransferase-like isoleucine patch superfamily enzyme